ncbi:YggS family pyridoxal phosphate-dependent enzyme [Blattabacterium cuenoti]|uniref:YggS family pyridoxal phosphate-dependent enzyme n=1 Tax=Blattabacterium cuenoti TaxID=1653831 RepID=UPI00163C2400|nr:YggS family pyridoxal phosphate-dependent enzyme [Blattabacterium cuenoti]
MNFIIENKLLFIKKSIPSSVTILVVSKNHGISYIKKLYEIGHRDFGENYVQEMKKKYLLLPKDIRWHMIGRIQSNKIKYIIPFIHLIHSVQKLKHIKIINEIGLKQKKVISCLLQIKICQENSKSGINYEEAVRILENCYYMKNVKIIGVMGMATLQKEEEKLHNEFIFLRKIYNIFKKKYGHKILSMGMSRDYNIAIKHGSNLIRLGTIIFGNRKKNYLF